MPIPPFALIVTSAGSSLRFNDGFSSSEPVKKEFLKIDDHTVLYKATRPFFDISSLALTIVTYGKNSEDETIFALENLMNNTQSPVVLVEGGTTRSESVYKALVKIKELGILVDYVAIHDGARPFVKYEDIINIFASSTVYSGAVPCTIITDSLKKVTREGIIVENLEREETVRVQTPQFFNYENLLDAYEKSDDLDATDDSAIYTKAGYRCICVMGSEDNKKITFSTDIPNAKEQIEEYIKLRNEGRKQINDIKDFKSLL